VKYAITTRRLLAGLGSAHARKLQFLIAEEGIPAAAYVVLSVVGNDWTLEECGDRDPSGARVGALLQALIAREPGETRPTIRAGLPASTNHDSLHDALEGGRHDAYARPRRRGAVVVERRRPALAGRSLVT